MKQLLINKDIKKLLMNLCVLFFICFLCGQFLSLYFTHTYKTSFYQRDSELAGALLDSGLSPEKTAALFTKPSSETMRISGEALLIKAGYSPNIKTHLLPSFAAFQTNTSLWLLLYSSVFIVLVLLFFMFYFRAQQKTIDQAVLNLKQFLDGNTTIRIHSNLEGSLYKLFALVNTLSTSLTAHLNFEKDTKKFLKTTMTDISHQLKTPLSALKMYNEILQTDGNNPDVLEKFTNKSEVSLNRMETLIQNLLKITRLDAGAIAMNFSNQKIYDLIHTVMISFETRAKQENKSFILDGDTLSNIHCDPEWITEAISNIVKNALDHTSNDGTITIKWKKDAAAVTLSIHDNGSGIHPEDIHHIFKRFYRSRFPQETQGTGLGLSLSKTIVTAHHGTLSVDSKPETGTLFTLTFLNLTKK